MKVVILCGGLGTRLREETEFKPKPLVNIGSMPILWHIMKLYSSFGHNDFILCLGYKGNMIKEFFMQYEAMISDFTINLRSKTKKIVNHQFDKIENWNITFVDTGYSTQTGGRVARIKDFVGEDENFFLTYGDGLADVDIDALEAFHRRQKKVMTFIGVHPSSVFGIVEARDGVVQSFKEKPQMEGMVNGGFFVCHRKVFDYLSADESCVLEERPIKELVKNRQAAVFEHRGFWQAMDTFKHVELLNKIWETGKAPWKRW